MADEDDKWEVYKDKRGEFRWRRRAPNGEIVGASTEGFVGRSSCTANADRHGRSGNPKGLGKDDTWLFYKDKRGEHRWRRRAKNGEIVGASPESYFKYVTCRENAGKNGYSIQGDIDTDTSARSIKDPIGMTETKRLRILSAIKNLPKREGKS